MYNHSRGFRRYIPPLRYIWCSLFTDHSDILTTVTFTFDRPVSVTEDAKLQLWEVDGEYLVKEATAYIEPESDNRKISADFGGFTMEAEKGYTFIIPEGTVIAIDGDPVMNSRGMINLNGTTTGNANVIFDSSIGRSTIFDLSGRKVPHPEPGRIYIREGRKYIAPAE